MSTKAKQQKRKQLKAEHARGKKNCIIHQGLLGWGLPTFVLYLVIMVIINMLFQNMSFVDALHGLFPGNIVIGLVVFSIGGVIMGNTRWKQLEIDLGKRPRKTKDKKK